MASQIITFRIPEDIARDLEARRAELPQLKNTSHAARFVLLIGLDRLKSVEESIRKTAFDEGVAAGRAAFRKKLAVLFAEEPEE